MEMKVIYEGIIDKQFLVVERIFALDEINIVNCYKLREILKEYNTIVNKLYDNEKESEIKKDINK